MQLTCDSVAECGARASLAVVGHEDARVQGLPGEPLTT